MSRRREKHLPTPEERLLNAAYAGDGEKVRALLAQGADVNTPSSYGETPLMGACQHDAPETVRLLIRAGANVNAVRDTSMGLWTPLKIAAMHGRAENVRLLLAAGADWSAESDEACELMDDACCSGDEETVQLFESLGARTSAAFPPLAYAVLRGREAEVRELLGAGNDPDEPDAEGRTPLVWAALFGQRAMAELMESAGAAVQHAHAALCAAARRNRAEMVDWLMDRGVDVIGVGDDEPLGDAIECDSLQAMERMLLRRADALTHRLRGWYELPLGLAVQQGSLAMVQLLLKHGAEVDGVAYEGAATPLSLAVREGRPDVVRLLLDHGADIEAEDVDGWTPLFYAETPEMANLLIARGAETEARDIAGNTPRW